MTRWWKPMARCVAAATASLGLSQAALAADLGRDQAAPVEHTSSYATNFPSASGLYVRGDASIAASSGDGFYQSDLAANGGKFVSDDLATQGVFGLGVGRRLSDWLRVDITGEYRIPATFNANANLTAEVISTGEILEANTAYRGRLSSFTGLLNLYLDLPRFAGFTPYIGGGFGFSNNQISKLTAASTGTLTNPQTGAVQSESSFATSPARSTFEFAWALTGGITFDLNSYTKLDLGYRYINLGSSQSAVSGLLYCDCGTIGQPLIARDLVANEFRFGIRWDLDRPASPEYAPLK